MSICAVTRHATLGAELTLVDVVEDNIRLAARVAGLLGLNVRTGQMETIETLAGLPDDLSPVGGVALTFPGSLTSSRPARFDLVFYTEWHNRDFNWFDLCRARARLGLQLVAPQLDATLAEVGETSLGGECGAQGKRQLLLPVSGGMLEDLG
jgi:hypothetical protein